MRFRIVNHEGKTVLLIKANNATTVVRVMARRFRKGQFNLTAFGVARDSGEVVAQVLDIRAF